MDPVTSYVENGNLKSINIAPHETGGSSNLIDMKLSQPKLNKQKSISGSIFSAYQTNGNQIFNSIRLNGGKKNLSFLTNINHRKARNYFDGNGNEVGFTQFEKLNLFGSLKYEKNNHSFNVLSIFDFAQNVGFAALPMDVGVAKEKIFKISHQFSNSDWSFKNMIYFNDIYHEMDDTKRENVAIHMDMPGWSNTYGFSGEVNRLFSKIKLGLNYELFQNYRAAEMTMYPPNEIEMFMYTWAPMNRSQFNILPMLVIMQKNYL